MTVTISYSAQVRAAAGTPVEKVDLPAPCSPAELVQYLCRLHEPLRRVLLDGDGKPYASVLLFIGDEQVRWNTPRQVKDGDAISILSPISGG